jgi:hypothetical protein
MRRPANRDGLEELMAPAPHATHLLSWPEGRLAFCGTTFSNKARHGHPSTWSRFKFDV